MHGLVACALFARASASAASENFSEEAALRSARLATATYCGLEKHGGDEVIEKWNCGKPCDDVQGMGKVKAFHGSGGWGADGFVGVLGEECVVSFRGSSTLTDYLTDGVSDYLVSLSGLGYECSYDGSDCKVGAGFASAYLTVVDLVHEALEELGCTDKPVVVTGHSLGAAEATMAVFDLHKRGYKIAPVYTFGQPRVGNEAFSGHMQSITNGSFFRLTHHKDPVLHLPPRNVSMKPSKENPMHFPTEVFFPSSNSKDYVFCEGNEDPTCSDQYEQRKWPKLMFILKNANDHTTYLRDRLGFDMDGDACAVQLKKKRFPWAAVAEGFAAGVGLTLLLGAGFFFYGRKKGIFAFTRPKLGDLESSLGASLQPIEEESRLPTVRIVQPFMAEKAEKDRLMTGTTRATAASAATMATSASGNSLSDGSLPESEVAESRDEFLGPSVVRAQ